MNFYNFLTDLCNKSNMRPTIGEISENEYIFDVDSSTVFEFAVIKYLQEKEEIHLFRIAYVTNLENTPNESIINFCILCLRRNSTVENLNAKINWLIRPMGKDAAICCHTSTSTENFNSEFFKAALASLDKEANEALTFFDKKN